MTMGQGYQAPKYNYRVLDKAQAAAQRDVNKAAWANRANRVGVVRITSSEKAAMDSLKKLPISMRDRAIKLSNYAAASVVRKQANLYLKAGSQERGPDQGQFPGDSTKTGTFDKKSNAEKAKRMARKSMVKRVWIKPKQWDSGATIVHMVGPRRPEGSQAWILEWGGVIQLWGSDRYYHLTPRPFMEPAGNGTVRKQQAAYIKRTRKLWRES